MFSDRKSFEDIGLPKGHAFPTLQYHEPTATLIVHTTPLKSDLPEERLSFRRVGDPRYAPVGAFPYGVSIESFVLDPIRPALYFVTVEWKMDEAGPRWLRRLTRRGAGGNWHGLYCFDLEEHRCDRLAAPGCLPASDGGLQPWITELLSVSNEGLALICKIPQGSETTVTYWLTRLELSDLSLTPITALETTFA